MTAADLLYMQAGALGIHSRDCREAARTQADDWTDGCAACDADAAAYAAAEREQERRAFEYAFETNLVHRDEMEREAALYG